MVVFGARLGSPAIPRNHIHLGLQLPFILWVFLLTFQQFCKLGGHIREAEPGSKDCTGEHLRPKSKCLPQHLYQGKNQGCPKNSDGL